MRSWFLRSGFVAAVVVATALTAIPADACNEASPSAGAEHAQHAAPQAAPAAATSAVRGVQHLANLPDAAGAIAINFIRYGHRDVMFVMGQFGVKSYDITRDPTRPRFLSEVSMPGMWQMEDTEVDPVRKLVFLARDPRAFGGNVQTGESGIYTVDASNPEALAVISYVMVPAGHTTSCINRCQFLWTGGPAKASTMPAEWGGRPIWVTDMRDPRNPVVFPDPIDLGRNDGKTDYSHDVQVDEMGIAWVSGRGGTRGYWTDGAHRDPLTGKVRRATALNPIPYAGGGIDELAAPSRFMHNSFRPVGGRSAEDGPEADGHGRFGNLIYVTEENFVDGCAGDGVLVIASLRGSFNGEGWRSTPENPFRLEPVGTWGVAGQEGSDPASADCSAHYFQVRGNILAQAFYAQGTRFLDISDPTNPTQIAYFRPGDGRAWAPYWHRGLVFVADNLRGVDILRLTA
ncbi:MAG TPA: hypothetical protein VGX25_01520 [Actinophytocola sp.]|uniref:LVIVD repeat-containing protein n=1 Tax=Actinophytocola sp. TaxID=1872138 RepID=UPI002DDD6D48|nr:hypothetical protein [Actinophytocola sp.]HEV2778056.1 hypothetical protein [Actinophytocola sp.]